MKVARTSGSSPIARRYAEALFALADEGRALDARSLDRAAQDLTQLRQLLAGSDELREVVASPVVGRDDQIRALTAVAQAAGLSELVQKFLGVLARNRRLGVLDATIDAFLAELARRRGEMAIEVTAATELTPAQQDALVATLAKRFGAKVSIAPIVDPSLIGGLIVRVGSTLIDGSVRSQLATLERTMKGAR